MSGKLNSISEFITAHPFITVGAILIIDGWVTNLFIVINNKISKRKTENIVEEVHEKDELEQKNDI